MEKLKGLYPIRLYEEDKDYELIKGWANAINQELPHKTTMPAVCAIAHDGEKDLACGFLFLANDCPVSVMEWVYFNPDAKPREKVKSLQSVVTMLQMCAVDEGHPFMIIGSPSDSLTRLYERHGFVAVAKNMTHLVKNIGV